MPKLDFQNQFSVSNIIGIFLFFNNNLGEYLFVVHIFFDSLPLHRFSKGYGPDVLSTPDGRSEPLFVTYELCKWFQTTLLLNEGIPRAYRGKNLRLKNILFFPSKSEGITCRFWWKYLQKVNAKCPQICDIK